MPVNQNTGENEHQFLNDQQFERLAEREAAKLDDRLERISCLYFHKS